MFAGVERGKSERFIDVGLLPSNNIVTLVCRVCVCRYVDMQLFGIRNTDDCMYGSNKNITISHNQYAHLSRRKAKAGFVLHKSLKCTQ